MQKNNTSIVVRAVAIATVERYGVGTLKRSGRAVTVTVFALVLAALADPLFGDGGYFYTEGAALAQQRQEVLMAFHEVDGEAHVTYVILSDYTGDAEDFAWVIPIPSAPVGEPVTHESDELFEELNRMTSPKFGHFTGGDLLIGCACSASTAAGADSGGEETRELVTVVREGEAGFYTYQVIAATDSTALTSWLLENGYSVPAGAEDLLNSYVQQFGYFLGLQIRRDAEATEGTQTITPVQFTCRTNRKVYPMAISRISAAEETEVVLYTIAEGKQQPVGFQSVIIPEEQVEKMDETESGTNYELLVRQAIAEGGAGTFITEYVGNWRYRDYTEEGEAIPGEAKVEWPQTPETLSADPRLTRMRTLLAPTDMTFDYEFEDALNDADWNSSYHVGRRGGAAVAGFSWLGLPLGFLIFRRMIRRRRTQMPRR